MYELIDEAIKTIDPSMHIRGDNCDVTKIDTLHIDGDIFAYYAATLPNIDGGGAVDKMQSMIASFYKVLNPDVKIKVHLTGASSNKGGRKFFSMFTQQQYQHNRSGGKRPELLDFAKTYLLNTFDTLVWEDREADDGVAYELAKSPETSCCVSRDKDFRMIRGWHIDWDTQALIYVDSYNVEFLGNQYGYSQLIYQLLVGDAADYVAGVPKYGHKRSREFVHSYDNFLDAFIEVMRLYTLHGLNIWATLCLLLMRQSKDGKTSTSFAEFLSTACSPLYQNVGYEPFEYMILPLIKLEEEYDKAKCEESKAIQAITPKGAELSVSDLWSGYH